MTTHKRPRGAPSKGAAARSSRLEIPLSPQEREWLAAVAASRGVKMAVVGRAALNDLPVDPAVILEDPRAACPGARFGDLAALAARLASLDPADDGD